MIRPCLAVAALVLTIPANAQSVSQPELDERYDHALAAGYKALMLCGAINSAEQVQEVRSPESVFEWELAGIQQPLDAIVAGLAYEMHRAGHGEPLDHVRVAFAEDMPPRIARAFGKAGCKLGPIGLPVHDRGTGAAFTPPEATDAKDESYPLDKLPLEVQDGAFGIAYGEDARTTAVIITQRREPVFARFAEGFSARTPQRTWSVAKSIAATYIGALVHRNELDVEQSAGLGLNEHDPRRAITFDNLLRMASGRYSDTPGNRTDPIYFGGATVAERAADWPMLYRPGTVFRYSNNDTMMAVASAAYRKSNYTPDEMIERIGMFNTALETDWTGSAFPAVVAWDGKVDIAETISVFDTEQDTKFTGGYILSSQVWSPAADLLELGQLYLANGTTYSSNRVLPENWVEYVSTPSGPQPGDGRGWGYGAGWWLLNNSSGIPADTILAAGNRGQFIVVIPSRDIVIVRRGEDPAGGSGFDIESFTRDVLLALDE